MDTKLAPSADYHPQTDGQSEVAQMIRAFSNYKKENWDEHLVDFEDAYNSGVNATTLFSPFFVNYGIHPRTVPINQMVSNNPSAKSFSDETQDITKFSHNRIIEQNNKMAKYAN